MKNLINKPNRPQDRMSIPRRFLACVTGALLFTVSTGTAAVPGDGLADLKVVKKVNRAEVTQGTPVTYEITVSNAGPAVAHRVSMVDTMPPGIQISELIGGEASCDVVGNRVVCNLDRLDPQQTLSLRIVGVPTATGVFTNRVTVTAEENDPNPEDNRDEESVHVYPRLDYGDAPAAVYPTMLASNGARHRLSPLYLGKHIDPEPDGQPSINADGDDWAGVPDDEDGVIWRSALFLGKTARVDVIASAPGRLDAWIDFNRNGVWNPPEQIFTSVPVAAGTNHLTFSVPTGVMPGGTYARFRLSQAGGLSVVGPAPDGEVEDYRVRLRVPFVFRPIIPERVDGGLVLTWENPDAILECAPRPRGPWQVVDGATSPHAVTGEQGPRAFYRLRLPIDRDDVRSKLARADLVFKGTVVDVSYRNSDVDEQHPVSFPCTFVTFDIENVLLGDYSRERITLRFLGGRDADGRVMDLSHSTHFDVGECSIVFVRKNGRVAIPLVNGGQGRFRVIGDSVFTEDGRAVVWTKSATIGFDTVGVPHEVTHNQLGEESVVHSVQPPVQGEDGTSNRALTAYPMSVGGFQDFLLEMNGNVQGPGLVVTGRDVPSMDIQKPFFIPMPTESRLLGAPPVLNQVITDQQERLEKEDYDANGGNPVLD